MRPSMAAYVREDGGSRKAGSGPIRLTNFDVAPTHSCCGLVALIVTGHRLPHDATVHWVGSRGVGAISAGFGMFRERSLRMDNK